MKKKPADKPTATARTRRKKVLTSEQVRSGFEDQLHQRYWAEKELLQLLPQLIKRTTSYELAAAIQEHLLISEQQVMRLIHVFDIIEERATGSRSTKINHLINQAEIIISGNELGYAGDSAIIEVCQKIMLHEIEAYSALREDALTLKEDGAAELLDTAISEEKNAHKMLSQIALSAIYFNQAG
ncbi:MAG TPA: DUF892 family protein [Flavobacterium sp.]